MQKSANLNIRTDPAVKLQAERIYKAYGITLSDAVNIFLRKSVMVGGLPFDMRPAKPNAETLAAFAEGEAILAGAKESPRYDSVQALFDALDREDDQV